MIQEIEISLAYGITSLEKSRQFNLSTYCTTDFFLRLIGKFSIGKVKKIVIECSEKAIEKKGNLGDDSINVVVIRRQIKIDKYFKMSVIDKKKWALSLLIDAFKELNKYYSFSILSIENVAKLIEELKYQNNYHFGKVISNSTKKLKAQLWIEHELDKFNLFVDIFKKDDELEKRFFIISTLPNWVAYLPVLGSLKWENEKLISLIGNKKKVVKKLRLE